MHRILRQVLGILRQVLVGAEAEPLPWKHFRISFRGGCRHYASLDRKAEWTACSPGVRVPIHRECGLGFAAPAENDSKNRKHIMATHTLSRGQDILEGAVGAWRELTWQSVRMLHAGRPDLAQRFRTAAVEIDRQFAGAPQAAGRRQLNPIAMG